MNGAASLLTTLGTAQDLAGTPGRVNNLILTLGEGADRDTVAAELEAAVADHAALRRVGDHRFPVVEDVLEVGERRLVMMRLFNQREGFGAKDDSLPEKFFNQPLQGGVSDQVVVDQSEFDAAMVEYYRRSGNFVAIDTDRPVEVVRQDVTDVLDRAGGGSGSITASASVAPAAARYILVISRPCCGV